jgi:hypothetical protein
MSTGEGWSQVSLSADGTRFGGTRYYWELDEEGRRQYSQEGVLFNWAGAWLVRLDLPPDTTLSGLDWSPVADELVGALTGEDGAWLWRWDAAGESLGAMIEILNPDQTILSTNHPVWSPDGAQVAFGLYQWDWWGENKYKTEIMVASTASDEPIMLVETDWGTDAWYPSWTADGEGIYYQVTTGEPGQEVDSKDNGSIWTVALGGEGEAIPWALEAVSYLPAAHPLWSESPLEPRPTPTPTASPTPDPEET